MALVPANLARACPALKSVDRLVDNSVESEKDEGCCLQGKRDIKITIAVN